MQPNRARIAKAVAALRSGKYRQARGVMHEENGSMCALGVMADISGVGEWAEEPLYGAYPYIAGTQTLVDVWPNEVAGYYGFTDYDPMAGEASIADMNDNGATFAEIADALEAAYLIAEAA